jgi:hypothetical protein
MAFVRMRSVLPLLVLAGALCACVGPVGANARHKMELDRRVPFDFGCPATSLVFTPLSTIAGGVVTSYGVQGCGKQAVYVMNDLGAWVLNTPK